MEGSLSRGACLHLRTTSGLALSQEIGTDSLINLAPFTRGKTKTNET